MKHLLFVLLIIMNSNIYATNKSGVVLYEDVVNDNTLREAYEYSCKKTHPNNDEFILECMRVQYLAELAALTLLETNNTTIVRLTHCMNRNLTPSKMPDFIKIIQY